MERLDEACRIGVGNAGRVSGAMDTVRYEPCPSRNGSGCSTAGHKTKASARRGTPWRGLGEIVSWELFGFVMPIIVLLR